MGAIKVNPSDIDCTTALMDSAFQDTNKEIVACNIIFISRQNGNTWFPFTWKIYCNMCTHKVSLEERRILNGFVHDGILAMEEEWYYILPTFIQKLAKFIKVT